MYQLELDRQQWERLEALLSFRGCYEDILGAMFDAEETAACENAHWDDMDVTMADPIEDRVALLEDTLAGVHARLDWLETRVASLNLEDAALDKRVGDLRRKVQKHMYGAEDAEF